MKVRLAEPQKAPQPVAESISTPKPRPPVRVDRRQPPPEKPIEKPEVRAGLSDSLAKPGTANASAPAIAVGNSSLATVNPDDANKPPPAPLSGNDVDNVSEAVADTPARCPVPPNLELTTDALNAGLTNAEVVIEVVVSAIGDVRDAKLKTGTGYDIDKIALKAALKLKCSPAILSGKAVGVAGKKLVWKVMYD
ncbi:MAG: energy transducer TonB [Silvanigrellaceae bacterium]